jgi:aspartyl protease family protein
MPIAINPQWQHLVPYALGGALLLILIFNIPFLGRLIRALFSLGLLAFALFVLLQQAPFEPGLARITDRLGLDNQEVHGGKVRIHMSPDGHFWARARINGVERRMLVDSGATITALSERTARLASVKRGATLFPLIMQTANGAVRADTGTIKRLTLGNITAKGLKVAISPALGDIDILGMNFLSQLASWRVEGRTLIMEPKRAERLD